MVISRLSLSLLAVHIWSTARASIVHLPRTPLTLLAQTTAVCQGQYSWMQNAEAQSPCLVAAFVNGACASGNWLIPSLEAGEKYDSPNVTSANGCTCSWAAYNLLSACTVCQGPDIAPAVQNWDAYRSECGDFQDPTVYFPINITFPNTSSIPFWAATDPSTWPNAHFDVTTAQSIANESKPDLSPSAPKSSQHASSKSSLSGGVLAGIIIGAIAVASFLIISVCFFCKFKHRKTVPGSQSETTVDSSQKPGDLGTQWNPQSYFMPNHQRSLSNMSRSTFSSEAPFLGMQQVATALHHQANGSGPMSPPLPTPSLAPNSPPQAPTSPLPGEPPMSPASLAHSNSLRSLLSFIPSQRQRNAIVPFTDAQPSGSGPRKETDNPTRDITVNANASAVPETATTAPESTIGTSETGEEEAPRPRGRLNPPAYTPYPAGVPSFNVQGASGQQQRRRPPMEKGESLDSISVYTTNTNTNPTTTTTTSVMTVTPPGSGSGPALMSQLGIVSPAGAQADALHPPSYGNNQDTTGVGDRQTELRLVNRQSLAPSVGTEDG